MKNSKKTLSIVATLLLFSLTTLAQTTNFSGKWTRNDEKTIPGASSSMNSVPVSVEITQTNGMISLKRTSKHADGQVFTYSEDLKFDGSMAASQPIPNMHKQGRIAWSADKTAFVETADYIDDQGKHIQKAVENWALSDGGKTLTIDLTLTTGDGEYKLHEVFDKN
ncbi:hypothetical protein [Mucilaginibacter pocheonensis]|uniref:Lipocalin-like domain-containing protein n=1 Tax=Mucilaginibacter pocheonensis TaxID=398050 RepID=A0ABU1T7L4_9SPHI|nr:hypothetical protein [Mucilaginibacter pocheonensis]MDR6941364.1 hypothetical protein [Mucilaginibacter pocheonensis]